MGYGKDTGIKELDKDYFKIAEARIKAIDNKLF